MNDFQKEVTERVTANGKDQAMCKAGQAFLQVTTLPKYSYNFTWLDRPIIQYPKIW